MSDSVMQFIADESGTTVVEYGLITAGISVALIATVRALGVMLNTVLASVQAGLLQ